MRALAQDRQVPSKWLHLEANVILWLRWFVQVQNLRNPPPTPLPSLLQQHRTGAVKFLKYSLNSTHQTQCTHAQPNELQPCTAASWRRAGRTDALPIQSKRLFNRSTPNPQPHPHPPPLRRQPSRAFSAASPPFVWPVGGGGGE